jgi:uncharacterized protein (UPF0335 family)
MGRPRNSNGDAPLRNSVNGDDLRKYVERIENLNEQQKELSGDRSQVYKDLKTAGYDRKTVQEIVSKRKLTTEQRQNRAAMLDMYFSALGDFADLPLGRAGAERLREGAA